MNMPASKGSHYIVAYCTCPPSKADELARELVQRGVCACVNIVPELRSVYRWKQAIEQDTESLLIIKTRKNLWEALEKAVRELHPYEVFELIASTVTAGNADYLDWIDEVTQGV